jgi:hypothetical protein
MITTKYTLLIILNAPFIVYAVLRTIIYFKEGIYNGLQAIVRVVFWLIALGFVVFAQQIYNYLVGHGFTDSAPINLADVLLVTATFLCLTLIIRLYTRVEVAEQKLTEINEAIALRDQEKRP